MVFICLRDFEINRNHEEIEYFPAEKKYEFIEHFAKFTNKFLDFCQKLLVYKILICTVLHSSTSSIKPYETMRKKLFFSVHLLESEFST